MPTFLKLVITVRKQSCGKVMFLQMSVSHSVHGGVCHSACWDISQTDTPLGRHSPAQCMLRYTPPCPVHAGIHISLHSACWDTQCPVHAGIHMAIAADGTHPTGMHSCLLFKCNSSKLYIPSCHSKLKSGKTYHLQFRDMLLNVM